MSQIRIGEKLGSFRLDSVVGTGAMGVVYRGINDSTGKPAAIKVVSGEISQRGKVYERFMREAEILKQFRHPNIVRFLAVGRYQGTSYIAMEFIQGDTLDKILEKRGPLPWREVVDLAIQICEALHYAHEHGVVHRDLKPSNLMLTDQGRVKLTDFGIAKDLDATALTATGRTLGTAAYMAPEQIRGAPAVSHKTDLYALGIVLYQLLVGKTPFEGSSPMILMHNHLNEKPPRPSDKVEDIPVVLDDLIVTLMAKGPADRPWDAAAVEHTLSELKKKAENGKSVKMVWSKDGSPVQNPLRLGSAPSLKKSGVEEGPQTKVRRAGKKDDSRSGSSTTVRVPSLFGRDSGLFSRGGLETMGLISALVAIAAFMVYIAWPPGVEYLYQHARPLMESNDRAQWHIALDEYIEPLDRRFPNHRYRDETRLWRDKILLEAARSRARILKTALGAAANNAELLYVKRRDKADDENKLRRDLEAKREWELLEESLKPDDPEERQWYLLARENVSEMDREIKDRQQRVESKLGMISEAFQRGRPQEAVNLQAELVKEYGQFTSVAHLFESPAGSPLTPAQSPTSESPKQAPESPNGLPEKKPFPEITPAKSDQPQPPADSPKPDVPKA